MDANLTRLLSDADRALGRLDGATEVLPNVDLFVAMYVRQEAVLSSQLEGTQGTLEDVLQFEVDSKGQGYPRDVAEIVNYIAAMNHGLTRLQELPLCLRLIKEIHGVLLQGVRGGHRTPGEFRKNQNYIGLVGGNVRSAEFVPPPVREMEAALQDLERFMHASSTVGWSMLNSRQSIHLWTETVASVACSSRSCCVSSRSYSAHSFT